MGKGLGRLRHQDPRDLRHLARDHLRTVTGPGNPFPKFKIGGILNQGQQGTCVGHGIGAWHNSKPLGYHAQVDHPWCVNLYLDALKIDPWPGNDGDLTSGTTVRAGLRIAIERGLAAEFVRIASVDEFDAWMQHGFGGIVVGSAWLSSMWDPSPEGSTSVDLSSKDEGGHCYFFFQKDKRFNRWYQNSWGEGWGNEGVAYMGDGAFRRLFTYDMEAYGILQTGIAG